MQLRGLKQLSFDHVGMILYSEAAIHVHCCVLLSPQASMCVAAYFLMIEMKLPCAQFCTAQTISCAP